MEKFVQSSWKKYSEVRVHRVGKGGLELAYLGEISIPTNRFVECRGIEYDRSQIEKPLFADRNTSELRNLGYAKVCVEVSIEDKLFDEVPVSNEGKKAHVYVQKAAPESQQGEQKSAQRSSSSSGLKGHVDTPVGRIIIAWDPAVCSVSSVLSSSQHILCKVEHGRWLVGGDFDVVWSRAQSNSVPDASSMAEFNDCVDSIDVTPQHMAVCLLGVPTGVLESVALGSWIIPFSPGPDGLGIEFFKFNWQLIKVELYEAISYIFANGEIPAKVNATTIALIPKTTNPRTVAEFRCIACYNNLYKCVTKILVNRMKPVISQLISHLQSAFIPGRQIGDNIHMLQELVQGYHKKVGNFRAALKIDLKKAYDTIEWGALWYVMEAMKFPTRFIYLVQQCVEGGKI
ncbi:hypothetical protein LIER_20970 [Lithospermum erythrorhizon]|uniref:Reverse transcriptase domain-containing protein n=1 Tax=Lithospermum erythrorhizon TaxID=34254 RepID=A0AAV3QNJ7_LITER